MIDAGYMDYLEYGPHTHCHGCGEIVYLDGDDGDPCGDAFYQDEVPWCSAECLAHSLVEDEELCDEQ